MTFTILASLAGIALTPGTAPVLPADTFAAAMRCGAAVTMADAATKSKLELSSQFSVYIINAQQAKPGTVPFFARINELSDEAANATMAKADAVALAPACRARFSYPTVVRPTQLPSDPFQRDAMCLGVLSMIKGAAQEIDKTSTDKLVPKIDQALMPSMNRLNDKALASRGFDSDAFTAFIGAQVRQSAALGEPLAVGRACGLAGV